MIKHSKGTDGAFYPRSHMVGFHFLIHYFFLSLFGGCSIAPWKSVGTHLNEQIESSFNWTTGTKICRGLILTLWLLSLVRCSAAHTCNKLPHENDTHWIIMKPLHTCFSLLRRIRQLWHIKINQPYIRGATHAITLASGSSRAVTQGRRRRLILYHG